MTKFYFTFGYGHFDSNGYNLSDHYTIVEAGSYSEARDRMIRTWGTIWAFQYEEEVWIENQKKDYAIPLHYVPFPPSKMEEEKEFV